MFCHCRITLLISLTLATLYCSSCRADSDNTRYTIDAMVGQVNGRAIYANDVFRDKEEELKTLGSTLPRSTFQQRVKELIVARLESMITTELILGEAERDLTDQERFGLTNFLKQQREELLRPFFGSVTMATEQLVRQTGRDLDQTMEDKRREVLVTRYFYKKINVKVNVTRRDIERYYRDHPQQYNPQPGRMLRLIRTDDPLHAKQIEKLLKEDVPFEKVAGKERYNQFKPDQGGLFSDKPMPGDQVFGLHLAAVNDAMLKLHPGECSPTIRIGDQRPQYWWVYLESQSGGETKLLRDVQLKIRSELHRRQFQKLTQVHRENLFRKGSFTSPITMTETLLEVAMSRYARPK